MKWYEEKYVSRRDWILDHLELLGMTGDEALTVLLIDFMNQYNMEITIEMLAKKTGLDMEKTNRIVSVLCAKNYLQIKTSGMRVNFLLDGLFETDTANEQKVMDRPLLESFENEFGRPLSQREMEKISEWNRTIDRRLIIYALREASVYRKLNLTYIEALLKKWIQGGLSADMIEEQNR